MMHRSLIAVSVFLQITSIFSMQQDDSQSRKFVCQQKLSEKFLLAQFRIGLEEKLLAVTQVPKSELQNVKQFNKPKNRVFGRFQLAKVQYEDMFGEKQLLRFLHDSKEDFVAQINSGSFTETVQHWLQHAQVVNMKIPPGAQILIKYQESYVKLNLHLIKIIT